MVTGGGFDPDEVPTRPDAAGDPTALVIARIHGECCPLDRKKLAQLVERWYSMPLDRRILVEMIALEFVK